MRSRQPFLLGPLTAPIGGRSRGTALADARKGTPGSGAPRQPATPVHTRWSWRIGSLLGVQLSVHVTFVLLLVWVALSYAARGQDPATLALGLLLIVSVFAFIVLHELAHALVARRYGIHTREIILLPIGGMAQLERMPAKPSQELRVSLAGPATNLAIAAVLAGLLALLHGSAAPDEVRLVGGSFVAKLLWINVSLAAFNLLPAFPMDGGRVLRSALALRLPYQRATELAAKIGQAIALMLALVGLLTNLLLLLIALFVWMGAQHESASVQMKQLLRDIPVSRAMITDFETLAPDAPLAQAVDRVVAGFQHDFPVVASGRVVGILTREDLVRALTRAGAQSLVAAAMTTEFETVGVRETLGSALERAGRRAIVLDDDGSVVGLLTPENIGELVLFEQALHGRGPGQHAESG